MGLRVCDAVLLDGCVDLAGWGLRGSAHGEGGEEESSCVVWTSWWTESVV